MRSRALLATILVLAGCTASGDPTTGGSADEVVSSANTDVQVLSGKAWGTIQWGVGGFEGGYDAKKCTYSNRVPSTGNGQYTSTATADCTEPLIAKLGPTVNRYVEKIAWIREDASGLTYSSFRYWCGQVEVVVAVKAAAWDAPSLSGIGFYANDSAIDGDGQNRTFYAKSDPRLVRVGEGTLKNEGHQKVYLYKFMGAGPCEPNGSGDNPGGKLELKPHLTYEGGFEQWESVPENHKIGYAQPWDRRAELLD